MAVLAVSLLNLPAGDGDAASFKTQEERKSYALGVDLARNFKRQGIECDLELVIQGLRDGASGEKLRIPEVEIQHGIAQVQTAARLKQAQNRGRTPAEVNLKQGELFLAENQAKPGVITLTNGLQYKILKAGLGRLPTADDTVEFNYRATRLDGTEFLCTNPDEPAKFKVKELDIAGWREALQRMPLGSKWRLFIPPHLAYRAQGVGRSLGPNETIISDLELVAIQ